MARTALVPLALAVAIVLAAPHRASAEPPFTIGARPVWFVSAGPTIGATVATGTRGFILGGELGVARIREDHVVGLYADGYRDFGADATYLSLGPELGKIRRSQLLPLTFGLDAGAVLRLGDERAFGATARAFLSVAGSVSLFARYAYLDAADDAHVVQVGVTFKFPLGPPFGAATR